MSPNPSLLATFTHRPPFSRGRSFAQTLSWACSPCATLASPTAARRCLRLSLSPTEESPLSTCAGTRLERAMLTRGRCATATATQLFEAQSAPNKRADTMPRYIPNYVPLFPIPPLGDSRG
eukprot:3783824-Pleurochrysis_carterae.AAC.3